VQRLRVLVTAVVMLSGCATAPENAYYPNAGDAATRVLRDALYRAARAASEDPQRYSFAMLRTAEVRAYTGDDGTFYFSEGLARQSGRAIDALVAHELAHELLDHVARRRPVSLSVTRGFTAFGIAIPGLTVPDFVANLSVVRAYTRQQEISADRKAVEVLRDMGYQTPRRVLADALRAAAAVNSADPRTTETEVRERLTALEPLEPIALTR
jgi:Zn-dependent protease with chaperone function